MLRARLSLILLFCAIAAPAAAQAPKSIDPGMSQAQVAERLGNPDASRVSGEFTYLFYHNGCIKKCGMDDVVILHKDSVVDAMFRSPEREYTGKSSSPRAIPADLAAHNRPRGPEIPSEAVQAGNPSADSAAKQPARLDSVAKSDSAQESPAKPKRAAHKASKKTNADTTHHDTISATLRIPVKPPIHSTVKPDSTRPDTATKRPPH